MFWVPKTSRSGAGRSPLKTQDACALQSRGAAWTVDFTDASGNRNRKQFNAKPDADVFRIKIEAMAALIQVQLVCLPYHNQYVTWLHRAVVLIDVILV